MLQILLGSYPSEVCTHVHQGCIYSLMFIAALPVLAKAGNYPNTHQQ